MVLKTEICCHVWLAGEALHRQCFQGMLLSGMNDQMWYNTFKWSAATPQLLEVRLNGYSAYSWLYYSITRFYYDVIFTMSSTEGRLGKFIMVGERTSPCILLVDQAVANSVVGHYQLSSIQNIRLWIHETKKYYLLYIFILSTLRNA